MGGLKVHFSGNKKCINNNKSLLDTVDISKVSCKKCFNQIEKDLDIAKNKTNPKRIQNKKTGVTLNIKEKRTPEETAIKFIKNLPDLYFLREFARSKHRDSKSLFKRNKLDKNDTKNYMKYGFTDNALKEIAKKQRRILKDKIKLREKCDCTLGKGGTTLILPDEEEHRTTCDRAKEYIDKYNKLMERYK